MQLSDVEIALLIDSLQFYAGLMPPESRALEEAKALMQKLQEPKVTVYACFNRDCPGPGPEGGAVYFTTGTCPYCVGANTRMKHPARLSELPRRPARPRKE